jgi:hypothetical protein
MKVQIRLAQQFLRSGRELSLIGLTLSQPLFFRSVIPCAFASLTLSTP